MRRCRLPQAAALTIHTSFDFVYKLWVPRVVIIIHWYDRGSGINITEETGQRYGRAFIAEVSDIPTHAQRSLCMQPLIGPSSGQPDLPFRQRENVSRAPGEHVLPADERSSNSYTTYPLRTSSLSRSLGCDVERQPVGGRRNHGRLSVGMFTGHGQRTWTVGKVGSW